MNKKVSEPHGIELFKINLKKFYDFQINGLKRNLETEKYEFDLEMDDLSDKLKDAKEQLELAYQNIDTNSIKSRESIKEYITIYNSNIDKCNLKIKEIETLILELNKSYENKITPISNQIEEYSYRLSKI